MKHYYQPTNYSCVQAAAAIFLSHFDIEKTPEDIMKEVRVRSWPGSDEPAGTPNQDIARYLVENGFDVDIVSFDVWVTDMSWIGASNNDIRKRLKAASGKLTAPMIGRQGSELYIQAYLDFIEAGGVLKVAQSPTEKLLKDALSMSPVMTTVSFDTLHGAGKSINDNEKPGQDNSQLDDLQGIAPNHNIVIEKIEGRKATIYDPWKQPGVFEIELDVLIAAIAAAQQECDNMLIVARKKS